MFSNTDNPVVRGFSAGDRVWADIGLDGGPWQGVHPNDALVFSGAGVAPDVAREWARGRTGVDAPTALKWRRQGFSPDRAVTEMALRRAEGGRSGPS